MYTARIISKELDRLNRNILVTVKFTDEDNIESEEVFTFGFNDTADFMVETIKTYIVELKNAVDAVKELKLGDIDLAKVKITDFAVFTRDEKNHITTG